MLISFSSISIDTINGKKYYGGPPNYGGIVLDVICDKTKLDFVNIANVSLKNAFEVSCLNHKNVLYNYIENTVNFKINHLKDTREVKLTSKPFIIRSDLFKDLNLNKKCRDNTVIVSPIINEFSTPFFDHLIGLKPKTIVLDLFNNDNGIFSSTEINLLKYILNKKHSVNLFLKLSNNEYSGISKHIKLENFDTTLLITKGKNGASLIGKKLNISKNGVKTKENSTIGAGDVLTYAFSVAHELGFKLDQCLDFANRIAAKSTEYSGIQNKRDGLKNWLKYANIIEN